ncbi:MAG: YHS domain-containing protein [Planctomycetaceae bacterium]|nr:YHS domain-containing protein [Planctomycetaceae bacterium]
MMCRIKISTLCANRKSLANCLATAAFSAMLVLPPSVFGQSRYPTFGLPSTAYGVSAANQPHVNRTSVPRSLSSEQVDGARRVSARQSGDGIRPVAHSQSSATSSSQQPSAVQRELQRLYQQDGREMPPMEVPSNSFQRPPVQATSSGPTPKRSVVDLMKGRDTQFNTVQTQTSVRPAPTAPQQQSPPRTADAVRPTGGRESNGGILSGIFNWGRRTPQSVPLSQPPQEPNPYQPPTYRSQPQVQNQATPQQFRQPGTPPHMGAPSAQSPQQPAATASRPPRMTLPPTSSATVKAPTPPTTPKPAPKPATTPTRDFSLVPLTEPVLAPPAEDEFFPDDVAETTSQPVVTPQPKPVTVQIEEIPQEELPQVVAAPEENPVVVPQPRNFARELGLTPQPQQTAEVTQVPEEEETEPQDSSPMDSLEFDDLFPEDEAPSTLASDDDGAFQLPLTSSEAPPAAEPETAGPQQSPYTGRKLASGAFEQPMETPAADAPSRVADSASRPHEPAPFFPSDEVAIESGDSKVAGPDETTLAPRATPHVANAVTQPSAGTSLAGSRMQQIAARDGVGLKGFCPVALRDERSLKDGKAAYISFYHAKAYYFASAQAKAAFDDNPEKYAPASNGHDVTLMALTGETLEGSLDNAVWYKDRLYLFSSDENLKTFMAAPSAMADK